MTIEISPELERFVQEQVSTGRFASPAEVLEASLRQMMQDEEFDVEDLAAFEEADREIAAGEVLDWKQVSTEFRREFLAE